jgi:hypothetical protein
MFQKSVFFYQEMPSYWDWNWDEIIWNGKVMIIGI